MNAETHSIFAPDDWPRRGYTHHGIYAGGGRVIHYAGFSRSWRRGPVEVVSLEMFSLGRLGRLVPSRHFRFITGWLHL